MRSGGEQPSIVNALAGSFESYISKRIAGLLGWPPGAAKPQRGEGLAARARASQQENKEELTNGVGGLRHQWDTA